MIQLKIVVENEPKPIVAPDVMLPSELFRAVTFSNGKPNLKAIILYAYISSITTEDEWMMVGYLELGKMFGFTKREVRDATKALKEVGLLEVKFETVDVGCTLVGNVVFVRPRPENLQTAIESASKLESKDGYIYLLKAENGLFKIGRSKNPDLRFGDVSRQSPLRVDLVHCFYAEDYVDAEAYLHSKYADRREVGEWFALSLEDVDWIKSIKTFAPETQKSFPQAA